MMDRNLKESELKSGTDIKRGSRETEERRAEIATEATMTVVIYFPPLNVASPMTLLTNTHVSHQPLVLMRSLLQKR